MRMLLMRALCCFSLRYWGFRRSAIRDSSGNSAMRGFKDKAYLNSSSRNRTIALKHLLLSPDRELAHRRDALDAETRKDSRWTDTSLHDSAKLRQPLRATNSVGLGASQNRVPVNLLEKHEHLFTVYGGPPQPSRVPEYYFCLSTIRALHGV